MSIDPWHIFTSGYGHMPKPYTAFVTLLDMVLFIVLLFNVGKARATHNVPAPSSEGPEEFQRVYRAQVNTVEQLVLHLPLLWMAAFAMDDVFAAAFGAIWTFGRILYARGYYKKAKRRHKGFMIGLVINLILMLGVLASTLGSF